MADKPTRRSLLHDLGEFLRCLFGGASKPDPGDPYAYRTSPVRRGPSGRSGAASVAEPEEENGFFPPRRS